MYEQTFDRLDLCVLTQEQHERTCNYWFTVTSHCMAHTAFTTVEGLKRWAEERGLKFTAEITPAGTWSHQKIEGTYKRALHMDVVCFHEIKPLFETYVMDNGDWTLGKVTEDDGIRTVHLLNPNCPRPVYDYWKISEVMK
jgi:hypothetical protein